MRPCYSSYKPATSSPLRVAYVVGGLPFGGVENLLMQLCLEYSNSSLVQPCIFNLSGTGDLLPLYKEKGIDVCCISNKKAALASHRLDTALALRRALRKFSPDIIHTSHFSANHLGRIAAYKLGIPLVMHLHSIRHEKYLERRISDKILSYMTTRYLAVSKAVAEVIQNDHNIAKRPVDVLYNAIPSNFKDMLSIDCNAEFGINSPIVIAVGRYVALKNFDLLIRAVRILHDSGLIVSLLLVGEGKERTKLEELCSELNLKKYVILTGFRNDVSSLMKSSDIFVMPSDFEGFPMSHIESMSCGLPGVISQYVPSLEIASESSLICDTQPEDIAKKLRTIIMDSTLKERLSKASVSIAQNFTMDNYATTLHSYYRGILNNISFDSIKNPLFLPNVTL